MSLLMQVCRDESLTLVLVTHDLVLADKYADRQLTMHDGKLIEGRLKELRLDEVVSL
jgi:predicted ABC-type transport system involved in lysophospholipase L1 biosynthesis ATPase subunit